MKELTRTKEKILSHQKIRIDIVLHIYPKQSLRLKYTRRKIPKARKLDSIFNMFVCFSSSFVLAAHLIHSQMLTNCNERNLLRFIKITSYLLKHQLFVDCTVHLPCSNRKQLEVCYAIVITIWIFFNDIASSTKCVDFNAYIIDQVLWDVFTKHCSIYIWPPNTRKKGANKHLNWNIKCFNLLIRRVYYSRFVVYFCLKWTVLPLSSLFHFYCFLSFSFAKAQVILKIT